MGPAAAGPVRALAWSADLVSRFASFRDMADAVGKRERGSGDFVAVVSSE